MAQHLIGTASTRRPRTAAGIIVAVGLLMGGCGVPPEMGQTERPASFFVSDEFVVARDLSFIAGSTAMTPTAEAQLDAFLRDIDPGSRDRVTVIGHGPLGLSRATGVARALRDSGVSHAEVAQVAGQAEQVTIAVARTVHLPTSCLAQATMRTSDGFPFLPPASCANDYNLARMVADPADLDRGRRLGPAEGGVAADAVRRYREGAVLEVDIAGGDE